MNRIHTLNQNDSGGIILPVVGIVALLLLGSGLTLAFSIPGKKLVNRLSPQPVRTLSLNAQQLPSITNYHSEVTITRGEGRTSATGIMATPDNGEFAVTLLADTPKSTVKFEQAAIKTTARRIEGKTYFEDPYDGTYHEMHEGALPRAQIETLLLVSPSLMSTWAHERGNDFQVEKKDGVMLLTINQVPTQLLDRFNDSAPTITAPRTTIKVDQRTYAIQSLEIEWGNQAQKKTSVAATFQDYNTVDIPPVTVPALNSYGDFLARESIYLRTNAEGAYDSLWPKWEQAFFGCQRCVNKYWDEDDDQLMNIQEFIFGSDPKKPDTDTNGANDLEDIQKNLAPATAQALPEAYAAAVQLLLPDRIHALGDPRDAQAIASGSSPDDEHIGEALIRDSVTQIGPLRVPANATTLQFKYALSGNPENGPYLTVFFNNKLLFTTVPIAGHTIDYRNPTSAPFRDAVVPFRDAGGQTGDVAFILNSVGPPGGELLLDPNTFNFGLGTTLLPTTPSTLNTNNMSPLNTPAPNIVSPTPTPTSRDEQVKATLREVQQRAKGRPFEFYDRDEKIHSLIVQADHNSAGSLGVASTTEGFCASLILFESRQPWCIDATTEGVANKQCSFQTKGHCQ